MSGVLALVSDAPSPRADGDVLLDAEGVLTLFPPKAVTVWWVRKNFAPEDRIVLGRRVYWWRSEAVRWINSRKEGAA